MCYEDLAMRFIDAHEVRARTPWPALIETLAAAFRHPGEAPMRHHHTMSLPGTEPDATLLLMPAWTQQPGDPARPGALNRLSMVKLVQVFPGNGARGFPAVSGVVVVFSGETGAPMAMLDGGEVTARRTAAASALAAGFLAREDARTLVMVGTGRLAPNLIEAHLTARPSLEKVLVWGRSLDKAEALTARLRGHLPAAVDAVPELEVAIRAADIVSCATLATEPLIDGSWLAPGCHVDLVGGFTPSMREADDTAIRRARVFVDTRDGAIREAGDIIQPLATGVLTEKQICGDLFALCRNTTTGRYDETEITLFKSVGVSLEDLAAAQLILAPECRASHLLCP